LLGIHGAEQMLNEQCEIFDFIVTAMGTGTTFAGLVRAAGSHQKVIGIPIHKHENLLKDIFEIDDSFANISPKKYEIIGGYHAGGYAKWNTELTNFITTFYQNTGIKLDPIYTGKAMFALYDLLEKKHFPAGSKILFMHTGGLQGIAGFEQRFGLKLFP
jgi:1-aminocyclopropane-1-carboxylate deaminase